MKEDNLINLRERTLEERQAIARKGNRASINSRRINKYFKLKDNYNVAVEELITALREYNNKYGMYCKDLNDVILTLRKYEYRHYKSLHNRVNNLEEEIDLTARQIIEEIQRLKDN